MAANGSIDRESGLPAYRQLADIIRGQIQAGELEGGSELPSKAQLAETYDLSLRTVEAALAILKTEGLIIMVRGRLTRVRPVRLVGSRRYQEAKNNYNPDQESQFAREHGVPWRDFDLTREYRTIPAPARVAKALGLGPQALVCERRWTHATDGVALRVSWSYLDDATYGDTILCDPNEPPWPGGTIAQLTHLKRHPVTDPPTEVSSRPGTDEECQILGLDPGTMVLESFRVHIEQGLTFGSWTPLECAVHVYPWYAAMLTFNGWQKREWKSFD